VLGRSMAPEPRPPGVASRRAAIPWVHAGRTDRSDHIPERNGLRRVSCDRGLVVAPSALCPMRLFSKPAREQTCAKHWPYRDPELRAGRGLVLGLCDRSGVRRSEACTLATPPAQPTGTGPRRPRSTRLGGASPLNRTRPLVSGFRFWLVEGSAQLSRRRQSSVVRGSGSFQGPRC
jgi:hypothetical protein